MRWAVIALCCIAGIVPVRADPCPGNPDALGTSRTVIVDSTTLPLIGTMHFPTSVPLEDHEVVLTFDDGPRPPYTDQILAALAHECVKATFFQVGYMVRANPQTTRRIYNEGHSIGSHSQNHPVSFAALNRAGIESEIGGGFATISAALGDPRAVSPFFRAPGLAQNRWLNGYLSAHGVSLWSTDTHAWDWSGINAAEIIRRAFAQLDAKGRGVVLLHDLQPATAMALPELLRQLKARGYRVVHAVAPGDRPESVPEPAGAPAPVVARIGWPVPAAALPPARLSAAAANRSETSVPLPAAPAIVASRPASPPRALATGIPARKRAAPTKSLAHKPRGPASIPTAWTLLGRT
jgi:peptidoglycan/xylan/chitin deacetylase (PgdA/CDA1 family)